MMRVPIGSMPPPSTGTSIQPRTRVTGTMSVSTTRIQGRKAKDEKYAAAARASASVAAMPIVTINLGGPMRGSPLRRRPFR